MTFYEFPALTLLNQNNLIINKYTLQTHTKTLLAQSLTLPSIPGQAPVELEGPPGLLGGGNVTIGSILSRAIPIILGIAGMALLLMILFAGFDFLTSGGDPKKLETGKQRLTYAILGFVIIFASFWLVQIFGTIFGLESMTKMFQ